MRSNIISLLFIAFLPSFSNATTMSQARQDALNFGAQYKNNGSFAVNDKNQSNIPGYVTSNPSETSYYKDSSLMESNAKAQALTSEQGKLMTDSMKNRPKVKVSINDDFLNNSRAIEGNPEEVAAMLTGTYSECKPLTFNNVLREVRTCDQYEEVDCVDGTDLVKVFGNETAFNYPNITTNLSWRTGGSCSHYYSYTNIEIVDVSKIKGFILQSLSFDDSIRITVNGHIVHINGGFSHCERATVFSYSPNIDLKPYLVNGTNKIELLLGVADWGFASLNYLINYDLNRKCNWIDNCVNIPNECQLQSFECLANSIKDNSCIHKRNLYNCSTTKTIESETEIECGSNIYCLNGSCQKVEDDSENDFVRPISYLASLNQMGKDNNEISDDLKIFSGEGNFCERDSLSYNHCCKDSGWGQDYAGASCSPEEEKLIKLQSKKLCHYVGSYCSKKLPLTGKCLKTKKSYCCFKGKISRVIMQQGRAQLGISWGDPKSPNCRGFSPDELERLRFDQMDLSEIASDIANSFQMPDPKDMESRIKESMRRYEDN